MRGRFARFGPEFPALAVEYGTGTELARPSFSVDQSNAGRELGAVESAVGWIVAGHGTSSGCEWLPLKPHLAQNDSNDSSPAAAPLDDPITGEATDEEDADGCCQAEAKVEG